VTEREKIFARIREALKNPATVITSVHGHSAFGLDSGFKGDSSARQWLPYVGVKFEERLELFRKHAAELKAEFQLFNDIEQVLEFLRNLSRTENWRRIGSHKGELTILAQNAIALPVCSTDGPYSVEELEACDAAITECDAIIAQTGSVLITGRSAGGRALSVLPPHHIVIVKRSQLVPDLTEAFSLLRDKYSSNYPSFISFITGPSRTGDIERVLVLGAHGPKKLTILCF